VRQCIAPCPSVPTGDPRADLVGELGARAVRHIPAGTLLGPYAAYVCTKAEYKTRKFCPVPGATRELHPGGAKCSGPGA
jgi:hypothetical protein